MAASYISKVAIVGAGGHVGKFITASLLGTGKHTVTAITRADSNSQLPNGLQHIHKVDYDSHSTLVSALRGQEALIITLAGGVPKDLQSKLVHAAADADVPYILPNEWSPDSASPELEADLSMIWKGKRETRELIDKFGKSAWISVTTGFWYEWSLAIPFAYGFDFKERKVTLFDEGDTKICTSTWPQVGRAVAALLSLPLTASPGTISGASLESLRNKHVYISSFTVSQNEMLESVLRVTGDNRADWTIEKQSSKERHEQGAQAMQRGEMREMGKWLYSRLFYPDGLGNHAKTHGLQNGVLGLPEEDIDTHTKLAIDRQLSEAGPYA